MGNFFVAIGLVSEEIFLKMFIFPHNKQLYFFYIAFF